MTTIEIPSARVEAMKQWLKDAESLTDSSLAFISEYTHNNNLEQIREYIQKIKESFTNELYMYPCIERNVFLQPRIQHPKASYDAVKEKWTAAYAAGKSFKVADIGCCFGTDTRKLVLDGMRPEDIHSIDIHSGYFDFGLKLFADKDTLTVNTLFADLSVPEFCVEHSELVNKFDFVYTGAILHLFAKDEGESFVRNIFTILASGGVYNGNTGGADANEPSQTELRTPKKDKFIYLHSVSSLRDLFTNVGFTNVNIAFFIRPSQNDIPGMKTYMIFSAQKP